MTLLRCIYCGHEHTLYTPASGTNRYGYDLGGASALTCQHCHGVAFRIVSEVRPRAESFATYGYGSLGEYVEVVTATPIKRGE